MTSQTCQNDRSYNVDINHFFFFLHHNIKTLFDAINNNLSKTSQWFIANRLSLNAKKTEYTFFHKKLSYNTVKTKQIFKRLIKRTFSITFTGKMLDENITWKDHIYIQ